MKLLGKAATRRTVLAALTGAVVTPAAARAAGTGGTPGTIWSGEYWAHKGAVDLYMFRKRIGAPGPSAPVLPVLFLVHGSSQCGRSTYDLTVPGATNYSMMDAFARYGYDVWTLDHEGYGRSTRTNSNSDIASGVEDLKAGMAVVRNKTGRRRAHFFGDSSGGIRAAAYAAAAPDAIDRLVLSAFTWTGKGAPTLTARAADTEFYRTHNRRPATRELYRSIFTRDRVGTADPRVGDALFEAEAPFGGTLPTGTYLDMVTKLPLVDPKTIHAPVLLTRGEYDGISTEEDLLGFYTLLPNRDRQFVVIPGSSHLLALGYNRARFWYAVDAFLSPPPRVDQLG